MKRKCQNPLCGKEFDRSSVGKNNTKYCSSSCSYIGRRIRAGELSTSDNFEEHRRGCITLPNGIEIRNDCMGKELANSDRKPYWKRNNYV